MSNLRQSDQVSLEEASAELDRSFAENLVLTGLSEDNVEVSQETYDALVRNGFETIQRSRKESR